MTVHDAGYSVLQDAVTRSRAALAQPGELLWLLLICILEFAVYASAAEPLYGAANVLGPLALSAVLAWTSFSMARRSADTMWAPLFWFRLATLVYFGLGNVVPFLLNIYSDRFIRSIYDFNGQELLKFNLVCVVGVTVCLAAAHLVFWLMPMQRQKTEATPMFGAAVTSRVAICFLLIGGVARYFIDIPFQFGLTTDTVPGIIIQIQKAFYAGVFLLSLEAFKTGGRHRILLGIIVAFEILVSVATFAKIYLMMILVFPFLGMLAQRVNLQRIAVAAAVILISYSIFQPVVAYGRAAIAHNYGTQGVSLEKRLQFASDYFRYGQTLDPSQNALTRFSYVNVGAYTINRFDNGQPGQTLGDAGAVLVPRLLWPDKPNITRAGGELFTQVYGLRGSQLGVGFFPEAYWNLGWPGVFGIMALLGLALAGYSLFSVKVMAKKDWIYLPIVLIGVNVGYRVDGFIVADVVGPIGMALVFGVIAGIASRLLVETLPKRSLVMATSAR